MLQDGRALGIGAAAYGPGPPPDASGPVEVAADGLAADEQAVPLPQQQGNDLAFSPDGARLVSSGSADSVMVWDTSSGEPVVFQEGSRQSPLGPPSTASA